MQMPRIRPPHVAKAHESDFCPEKSFFHPPWLAALPAHLNQNLAAHGGNEENALAGMTKLPFGNDETRMANVE
jgi:hypothetical protein